MILSIAGTLIVANLIGMVIKEYIIYLILLS